MIFRTQPMHDSSCVSQIVSVHEEWGTFAQFQFLNIKLIYLIYIILIIKLNTCK